MRIQGPPRIPRVAEHERQTSVEAQSQSSCTVPWVSRMSLLSKLKRASNGYVLISSRGRPVQKSQGITMNGFTPPVVSKTCSIVMFPHLLNAAWAILRPTSLRLGFLCPAILRRSNLHPIHLPSQSIRNPRKVFHVCFYPAPLALPFGFAGAL
jgi:hypothetical protein